MEEKKEEKPEETEKEEVRTKGVEPEETEKKEAEEEPEEEEEAEDARRMREYHPCPHRHCALLDELENAPDIYDLLHSYCTFPESLNHLYGLSLSHLRCDSCLYIHALLLLQKRQVPLWKRIKNRFASFFTTFSKRVGCRFKV